MEKRVFTIPNVLSCIRILLIIPIVAFFFSGDYAKSFVCLVLSGMSDVADGIIARKCNMCSELGKALDPVADKLTQIAVFGCIGSLHKMVLTIFVLLVVYEIIKGTLHLIVKIRTGKTYGSEWHGKLTTVLLYATAGVHVIFPNIDESLSMLMLAACALMMTYSFANYISKCAMKLKENKAIEENK